MDTGKIVEKEPGKGITASGTVSGEEEFFQDHFPGFPVVRPVPPDPGYADGVAA